MPSGQKHLIKCRCILNQFRSRKDPPSHQFVVFSEIDDSGAVVPKYTQCNNCGIVHKVVDITRSIIVGKESSPAILTLEEVMLSIPASISNVLEKNKADLATCEQTKFILENKKWGEFVVLNSELEDSVRQGKCLHIFGENLFKVEPFERKELF